MNLENQTSAANTTETQSVSPESTNQFLVNQRQLARLLQRSVRFVQNLTQKRIIPVIRLSGKCLLYDPAKVKMALERFEIREVGR